MTREDIIRMAREAEVSIRGYYDETGSTPQELERFAALVAAAEREACAKVCEEIASSGENNDRWTITRDIAFNDCAAAIRARGTS